MIAFNYKNTRVYEKIEESDVIVETYEKYMCIPIEVGFDDEDYAVWYKSGRVYLVSEEDLPNFNIKDYELSNDEELIDYFKENLKIILSQI